MASTATAEMGKQLRVPPRSPRTKQPSAKLIRSRSGSAAATMERGVVAVDASSPDFEIVVERMELTGYQVYAVEKWIVERNRPMTLLTVYTGDPSHKIIVTALSPMAELAYPEAVEEFTAAVQHLRKQVGGRPKQIPQGTLMVTSLAHFRSDYTIVHVPEGDFLAVQDRLYSNINLLRMGCSGRGAVTLDEPSETTKDRFKSMYLISDAPPSASAYKSMSHSRTHSRAHSHPATLLSLAPAVAEGPHFLASSNQPSVVSLHHSNASQASALVTTSSSRNPHFASYVLELVKLVQASLAICGLFPLPSPLVLDGLLCDVTVEGLRRWGAEIGEKFPGFEATERLADPNVISLLLSFVLSARNKLSTLVQGVPKDPFLHPHEFLVVLTSYVHSQSLGGYSSVTQPTGALGSADATLAPTALLPSTTVFSLSTSLAPSGSSTRAGASLSPNSFGSTPVYLTLHLHNTMLSAHEKIRHVDSRRVHRVLLSKLDVGPTSEEDATDEEKKGLGGKVMGFVSRTNVGAGGIISPIPDLGSLMRTVLSGRDRDREREKDRGNRDAENWKERVDSMDEKEKVAGSLRALWGGKVEALVRMRERAEGRWIHPARNDREREYAANWKDKDRRTQSDIEDPVLKSNGEDDLALGGVWSGKVQKKLEMWAGINRSKRSVDLSGLGKLAGRTSSVVIPLSAQSSSSGHVYPASEVKDLGIPTLAVPQNDEGVDEDELLPSSEQVSPISVSRSHRPFMLTGSADVSSANLVGADMPKHYGGKHVREPRATWSTQIPGTRGESSSGGGNSKTSNWERQELDRRIGRECGRILEEEVGKIEQDGRRLCRRHTFHDLESVRNAPVLRVEWMQIDVELCGQILIMRRREAHLEGVIKCLEYLTNKLSRTNASLRTAYEIHDPIIKTLTRTVVAQDAPSSQSVYTPLESASTVGPPSSLAAILQMIPSLPPVAALQYETAQLRVGEMWAGTRALRAKVWELRAKVFGDELTTSANTSVGASGSNRLRRRSSRIRERDRRLVQWTLDGNKRLVDANGRTEQEAEEDRRAAGSDTDAESFYEGERTETESEGGHEGVSGRAEEEEEEERQWVMPMWLLRMLTSWGSRLGFLRRGGPGAAVGAAGDTRDVSQSSTTGVGTAG
ncbi:hypothetical protein F5141DRAFT_1124619 [Pisolithus sp. B1]|nr:hypothetical protein F5141DRAFT_1124619 [Pisolithus sp. B1]